MEFDIDNLYQSTVKKVLFLWSASDVESEKNIDRPISLFIHVLLVLKLVNRGIWGAIFPKKLLGQNDH